MCLKIQKYIGKKDQIGLKYALGWRYGDHCYTVEALTDDAMA